MARAGKKPGDQPANEVATGEAPLPKPRRASRAPGGGGQPRGRTASPDALPAPKSAVPPGAAGRVEGVRQKRHDAQQLAEVAQQMADAHAHLNALRTEGEAAAQELAELRRQAREAHQAFLRECRGGADQVRGECAATATHLAEVRQHVQDAGRRLVDDFEHARTELDATEALLRDLPQGAEHLRQRIEALAGQVSALGRRLGELDRAAGTVRRERGATEREAPRGADRLATSRPQTPPLTEGSPQAPSPGASAAPSTERAAAPLPPGGGRLGVTVGPGVVVAEVLPDTPAAAGLAPGDLILAVGEREVFTGPELREALHAVPNGDQATLRIQRGKAPREVAVRLATPTDEATTAGGNSLGVTVDPGVVVAEVLPDTPAAAAGLAPGDLVLAVNDVPVLSGDELHEALLDVPSGVEVQILVGRGGSVRVVPIQLA